MTLWLCRRYCFRHLPSAGFVRARACPAFFLPPGHASAGSTLRAPVHARVSPGTHVHATKSVGIEYSRHEANHRCMRNLAHDVCVEAQLDGVLPAAAPGA